MKKNLYFGIISIYISQFFVILSRLFFNTNIFTDTKTTLGYSYIWIEQIPFKIRFAIWLPAVIGIIFIIVYFKQLYNLKKKKEKVTSKE